VDKKENNLTETGIGILSIFIHFICTIFDVFDNCIWIRLQLTWIFIVGFFKKKFCVTF